jgi:hypothetical protein
MFMVPTLQAFLFPLTYLVNLLMNWDVRDLTLELQTSLFKQQVFKVNKFILGNLDVIAKF